MDPGLSSRGESQALALAKLLGAELPPFSVEIWASPKRRSQDTLRPLSLQLQVPLHIHPALDERRSNETAGAFRERLQDLQSEVEALSSLQALVLCSHLDWLEEWKTLWPLQEDLNQGPLSSWSPASYVILEKSPEQALWEIKKSGGPHGDPT